MRIGILSLVLHTNYGGILQSYALQTVLERLGHEVYVFNREQQYDKTRWKYIPKRFVKRIIGRDVVIFQEARYKKEAPMICQHIWNFRKKYIHEYIIKSFDDIKKMNLDAIIVGSDQVWRPCYFKSQWNAGIENAFLSFTRDWKIKRIAYAASFGVNDWEFSDQETQLVAEAGKLFSVISVREDSGIKLLKEKLNLDSIQVLDPTLLLSRDDYVKLIEKADIGKSSGNLLTYILNPSSKKTTFINEVAKAKGLIPFSVNNSNVKQTAPIEQRIMPSIEKWLQGFNDAKLVVTDSFHACVFSIMFHKQFVVVGNKERGMSRFESLLDMFGLKDRLVNIGDDISSLNEIDFSAVDKIYDILKEESMSFLFNALKLRNNAS